MKDETYIPVEDPEGKNFLCPANNSSKDEQPSPDVDTSCIEEDVVQRYSGNLRIKN